MFRSRAFRSDNHSSEVTGRFTRIDHARDLVVIERDFGNQNDIGATGDAALQRDPPRVASHYFDDNDPPMAGRRSVQSIQRIHHDINGRIETERNRRRFEIVVDRLRYADAVDASLLQLLRSHQRSVAANDDQRLHAEVLQDLPGVCNALCRKDCPIARADFCNEMAAIGGTKNRPAQRHDSGHSLPIENDVIARRQQAFKAIAKTNHFPSELIRCQHYGAQNRIKPRTVATAGQNTNARFHFRRSESEQFLWIRQTTGSRPLIIQLPAALQKRRGFAESIRAAEEHYHQMTLIHGFLLALANHFRLTIRIQNQTLPGSRRGAGLDAINAHFAQEFVRVPKHVIESLPRSIERNLAFLLRHIETETGLVHCVSSETRHVFGR